MNPVGMIGIAVGAFLAVVGIFFVIGRVLDRADGDIEGRLDQFVSRDEKRSDGLEIDRSPSRFTQTLDKTVSEQGFARQIKIDLARANFKLTVGEYMILVATSILGSGVITYLLMHQNLFMTLGGLVLGFFLWGFGLGNPL